MAKTKVRAIVVNVGDDKHHLDIALENMTPKILVMISSGKYYDEITDDKFQDVLVAESKHNLKKELIKTISVDPFHREITDEKDYASMPVIGEIIGKFSTIKKKIEKENKKYDIEWISSLNGGTNQQAVAISMLSIMYGMRTYYVQDRMKAKTLKRYGGAGGSELFNWVPYITDIFEGIEYLKNKPKQTETLRVLVYDGSPCTSENIEWLLRNNKIGEKYPTITRSMISKRIRPLVTKGFVERIEGSKPYSYKATDLGKVIVGCKWPIPVLKEN